MAGEGPNGEGWVYTSTCQGWGSSGTFASFFSAFFFGPGGDSSKQYFFKRAKRYAAM